MTSTTPPRESPTLAAALTSATMAASASGSKQRTCDSSTPGRSARRRPQCGLGDHRTDLHHVADDADAQLGQEGLGQGAGRHAGGRLPGGGPLEDVTGVVEAILLHARAGRRGRAGAGSAASRYGPGPGDISCSHFGHSVLPISMATGDPRVRPCRTPAIRVRRVLLEAHPRPAAESEAAPGQFGLDLVHGDGEAGGQTFEDDDEALPVGFAGGEEAQHGPMLPSGPERRPWTLAGWISASRDASTS